MQNEKDLELAMGDISGMEDLLGTGSEIDEMLGEQSFDVLGQGAETSVVNVDSTVLDADALSQVRIPVTIELGRTEVTWEELQKLTKGSVLRLTAKKDDPLLVTVRGTPVAKCSVEIVDNEYQVVIQELKGS